MPTTPNKPRDYYRNRQRDRLKDQLDKALEEASKKRLNEIEAWKPYIRQVRDAIESALTTIKTFVK